ncbi:MAG TPA: 4-hydroxy-tetrahydrodipicolinate synthase [Clostridia bacterium]|nr:4-hydroxy-tetrahydrodipicolinate synthase [Clostridia bacterium]
MRLGSVVTAMVTPFDSDLKVDYKKAKDLASRLVDNGSDAILVTGTTGESPTLSDDEKIGLLEAVLEAVGDRAPVMAGTGSNCTEASVALTKRATSAGAHAILAVTPYYNKPPQSGLVRHFRAIADATDLDIMLYNVPGRTGVNMSPQTVKELAGVENIVAVKESSGSLDQVSEIIRICPPDFLVYSGDDSLTLPMLSVGAVGVVSVASHLVGNDIKEMISAYKSGNVGKAKEIHLRLFELFRALFVTTNPIPVKAALRMHGVDVGGFRPPLVEPEVGHLETIRKAMEPLGLVVLGAGKSV